MKTECFPLKIRKKTRHPFLPVLFNILLKVLTGEITQGKETKGIQIRKKEVKLCLCR
jgi:hypothetical protein